MVNSSATVQIDEWEDSDREDASEAQSFDLAVPGLLHVLQDLLGVAPVLDSSVKKLIGPAEFLRAAETKQRLLATCFSSGVSTHLQDGVRKFGSKVHRGRWGTVAFATTAVLELQNSLWRFWSLERYLAVGRDNAVASASLMAVDATITSSGFWVDCCQCYKAFLATCICSGTDRAASVPPRV